MIKNHFDYVPEVVGKKRSVFPYHQVHSGSYEMGRLYPLDVIEVRPGSTYKLDIAGILRSGTLVHPMMDDIIVDIVSFYVRNRSIWTHWEQFLGSNDEVAFTETNNYVKPYIMYCGMKAFPADASDIWSPGFSDSTGSDAGELTAYCNSLACHFGLPVMEQNVVDAQNRYNSFKFDALWVRGFYKGWNELFRDENLMDPVLIALGDTGEAGQVMGRDGITPVNVGPSIYATVKNDWQLGFCPKVCKLKDYFTSATPSPVRSTATPTIPVDSLANAAVIKAGTSFNPLGANLKFGSDPSGTYGALYTNSTGNVRTDTTFTQPGEGSYGSVTSTNLYLNLANTSSIAISKFRDAILLNRLYENRLRIGGRYPELLQGEFGIKVNIDNRAQLLTQKRFNIAISEVVSTAQTDVSGSTVNAVGDLGGMSKTPIKGSLFTASFDEDGLLYITMCIRQRKHTYVQGWQKKFYRETWLDYYWPSLNGTSDIGILRQELVAVFDYSSSDRNTQVFGYQEYGADEKVQFARAVGMLNPVLKASVKGWNLADVYDSSALGYPVLDSKFLVETPSNLNRDLVITNTDVSPQFIGDFLIHGTVRKVMPVYNIPGVGGVL